MLQVDSGGGGSAEVMVYSLGWGMGEPERRGADRKRSQPAAALSLDDGHEVDVLPLNNQVIYNLYFPSGAESLNPACRLRHGMLWLGDEIELMFKTRDAYLRYLLKVSTGSRLHW